MHPDTAGRKEGDRLAIETANCTAWASCRAWLDHRKVDDRPAILMTQEHKLRTQPEIDEAAAFLEGRGNTSVWQHMCAASRLVLNMMATLLAGTPPLG